MPSAGVPADAERRDEGERAPFKQSWSVHPSPLLATMLQRENTAVDIDGGRDGKKSAHRQQP